MSEPRVRTVDVAVAAVIAAAALAVGAVAEFDVEARAFDALAAVLIAVAGGVLALHRRAPLAVLAVTTTALAVYSLRDYQGGPVFFTWTFAVFAVSLARGPSKAWLPAAVSTVVILAAGFYHAGFYAVLWVSWCGAALLLGGSIRGQRAERAVLQERVRHLATSAEEEARRRVAEERLRIARDLHDSIAHSMASISVQAGVGAHVIDERPEDARASLVAIKRISGKALAELRATLQMLRSNDGTSREIAGLDQLPSLVETSRVAGLPVEVEIEGDARPLPPAVDATAYRIVQEALTNVIRHAGPARATVAVRHGDGAVEIEVTDDGRGVNGNGAHGGDGGHGLIGMRERVVLLGGELRFGARPSGGYRVRARLPL